MSKSGWNFRWSCKNNLGVGNFPVFFVEDTWSQKYWKMFLSFQDYLSLGNFKQLIGRTTTKVTVKLVRKFTKIIVSRVLGVKFPIATFYWRFVLVLGYVGRMVMTNCCLCLIFHLVNFCFNIIEWRITGIN